VADLHSDGRGDNAVVQATPRSQHEWPSNRITMLAVAVTVVTLLVCVLGLWMTRCPLSAVKAEDVGSIRVTLYTGPEKSIKYTLERDLVPRLLAALTPSYYDWRPAAWVVLGMLDIELKDGSRLTVDLYDSHHDFAAFSIDRRYFRGGSNDDLKRLLRVPRPQDRNGNSVNDAGQRRDDGRH
jgi:hypothetical protein